MDPLGKIFGFRREGEKTSKAQETKPPTTAPAPQKSQKTAGVTPVSRSSLPGVKSGHAEVSYTYSRFNNNRNFAQPIDLAYQDPKSGVTAVFDVADHDNFQGQLKDEIPLYSKFCKDLSKSVRAHPPFTSVEEARKFLESEFEKLEQDCHEILQGKRTRAGCALFCGFAISIEGKRHFIAAQTNDCCAIHINPGKEPIFHKSESTTRTGAPGLGQRTPDPSPRLPTFLDFPIESGSRVVLFSDGIGEYLTKEEITSVVTSTSEQNLLQAFKEKILAQTSDAGRMAASGLKSTDRCRLVPNQGGDDISCACVTYK